MIFTQFVTAKLHILFNIHEEKSIFLQISDKLALAKSQSVSSSSDRQTDAAFVSLAKYQQVILHLKPKIFLSFEVFAQISRISTNFVLFLTGGLVPEHRNHPLE